MSSVSFWTNLTCKDADFSVGLRRCFRASRDSNWGSGFGRNLLRSWRRYNQEFSKMSEVLRMVWILGYLAYFASRCAIPELSQRPAMQDLKDFQDLALPTDPSSGLSIPQILLGGRYRILSSMVFVVKVEMVGCSIHYSTPASYNAFLNVYFLRRCFTRSIVLVTVSRIYCNVT